MTRYSNPLPHNQVPNPQGRPAGAAPQAPQLSPYDPPGWPQPAPQPAPRNGRAPASPAYADPAGFPADPRTGGRQAGAGHHDPYAALRPDGYGYAQSPQPAGDPYGLAGYTAPQPQSQQGYGSRAPQAPAAPPPSYGTPAADPYGATGYGQPAAPGPSSYGASQSHAYEPSFGSAQPAGAPQPHMPPSYGSDYGAPQGAGQHAPAADQWGAPSLGGLESQDYDLGYGAHQGQWGADPYGEPQLEPALGPAAGYPPPQHGTFDQSYAEDEAQYEDEPRRGGWKKMVGLVACTVLLGGGATIAYNSITTPADTKTTPLVKGASGPSKVKPSEPGGKQFAHTDSKIMGRLGENGSEAASDPAGVRRVPVVTVGRDGSIQPPPSAESEQTRAVVAVPGLTVIDGLGGDGPSPTRRAGPGQQPGSPPVQMAATSPDTGPVTVAPPARRAADTGPAETGAVPTKAATAAPKADAARAEAPRKKVAAATPAATGPKPTGAGYVAVLASVPASASSRIDALKQFADMQQKYGLILQNKTPDVQEANLGEKGTYHRLLVGPPGSRDSASSLCTQLKAQGYSGCWVTAY